MQTVWKGTISFGLVSIPVRLVAATEEKDVSFRQVHAADGGRIRYKRICDNGGHEVAYADIAKGYELPDGDMVVLTEDDLADLPIASSKAVNVLEFVPFEQIDPTALVRSYYAEPTADAKPYVLLRDALVESGRVGVVKIALRNRERLAVLRSHDGVLVVQTMLWPDEVRRADFGFVGEKVDIRPQEMKMAESYVDTMSGDFEPEDYVDEYRQALLEVVQAKVDGAEITPASTEEPAEGKVVDLMEALRRSVEAAKKDRGESPARSTTKRAPAKKAAAKKAPAKSAKKAPAKSAKKAAANKAPAKSAKKAPAKPAKKAPAKKSEPRRRRSA